MREATFYIKKNGSVQCLLCPHHCVLNEGETGDCRTRININGKLMTIAYGNPCALHVDPIEKKPLYHFLPGQKAFSLATAGCNLACLNCQNADISQQSPENIFSYDLPPQAVVEKATENNTQIIAYTYTDPVAFYEYTYDTAKLAKQAGLKNVMISAGYINPKPLRQLARYMDAANIDLKTFNDSLYQKLSGAHLKPVLKTLEILKEEGVWIEITNLLIPGWTDDLDTIKEMSEWLVSKGFADYPIHFSRFYPSYKLNHLPPTPVKTIHQACDMAESTGMKYVYAGNVPDSSRNNTKCPYCGNTLIKRSGFNVWQNLIDHGRCPVCNQPVAGIWK